MGTIIKLDKHLINQISAGEVVERPISVVKELIENAIDAQSTQIKIEIENGGKTLIKIDDNGKGIDKDDLGICLEKYTTSKITSLKDLHEVMTFGFRGEALASISSVSEIDIVSKTESSHEGYHLSYSNENGQQITPCSHNTGTQIQVANLFYNTPARLNYLKQDKTEYAKILDYIHAIGLSYPEIGFEFISDKKKILKYHSGETLSTRIYEIFGDDFFRHILDINFESNGVHIHGYISDPKISFQNKNKQFIFVNHRPIFSPIISKALFDAYNRFIPHGGQPGYILHIDINPTVIDVNVHPRKTEIRFENEQNIYRLCHQSVLSKLESVGIINDINNTLSSSFHNRNNSAFLKGEALGVTPEKYFTSSGTNFKEFSPYKNTLSNPNQGQITDALNISKEILGFSETKTFQDEHIGDLHYTKLGKIVGQTFQSYIIVEREDSIIILDQHALAERIIYEKLITEEHSGQSQQLLIPENIKISHSDEVFIQDNSDIFKNMGFEFDFLSNNILTIYSIPDFIKKENISQIFLGVLQDLETGNHKSKTLQEVKNKIYAYTACRSAIKFGNKLNLFEMNKLLNDAHDGYTSTCPHGRPVIFEINLNELKNKYER